MKNPTLVRLAAGVLLATSLCAGSLRAEDAGAVSGPIPVWESLYRSGIELRGQMKEAEAKVAFQQALELAPANAPAEVVKDIRVQLGSLAYVAHAWQDVVSSYQSLTALYPNDPQCLEWYERLWNAYWSLSKREEAFAAADRAVQIAKARNDGGMLRKIKQEVVDGHVTLQEWPEAITALKGLLEEYANAPAGQADQETVTHLKLKLADVYREAGTLDSANYDNAVSLYRELLEQMPQKSASLRFKLAVCLEGKQEYNQALDLYKQIIGDDSADKEVKRISVLPIATCLRKQGNYREEIEYLEAVAEQDPDNRVEAMLWIGEDGFFYLKDYDMALAALRQVLQEIPSGEVMPPERAKLMEQIAMVAKHLLPAVLAAKGEINEAVSFLRETLSKNPNASVDEKSRCLDHIAGIYFRANRCGEAVETYKDVLRLEGVSEALQARARYQLGVCSDKLGDRMLAVDYMNEVVSRYPDSAWVKKARGMLYLWGQLKTSKTTTSGSFATYCAMLCCLT